jgi:2,3-bisphosphoglycerate-dependent phosphoglycerate mutase
VVVQGQRRQIDMGGWPADHLEKQAVIAHGGDMATLKDVPELILLRHGQSEWNALNLFTGWEDVELTDQGRSEASEAGRLLGEAGVDVRILHTSLLTRAILTAHLALEAMERLWVPAKRDWRLNERHYGDLQGRNKLETAEKYGADQVKIWRRSYATPPPVIPAGDPRLPGGDPRYRDVAASDLPASECLADVVVRTVPYFTDEIIPDLMAEAAKGGAVLVVAHGNSLRALRKHLDGIGDDEIVDLEIPTGIPYRYVLSDSMEIIESGYLGDPDAAAEAAKAVGRQAG